MKESNTSVEKERLPLSNNCYIVHRYTVKEQCSLLCKPTSKLQTSHVMTRLCWTTYGSGFVLAAVSMSPADSGHLRSDVEFPLLLVVVMPRTFRMQWWLKALSEPL